MSYPANTIATWFLHRAREEGEYLTQMKLQKLVYIAHGWNLGLDGGPLILETVEAWQYGPVIRDLYERYLAYGAKPIVADFEAVAVDTEDGELLEWVWNQYKRFTAGQLSTITHQSNTPWTLTYQDGKKLNIPEKVIEDHYRKLSVERTQDAAQATS